MATSSPVHAIPASLINTIVQGDCIEVMRQLPANNVDFILTDPPYLVNFRDRFGRKLQNDTDSSWLKPAFAQAYRVLKQDRLMFCFYGLPRAHRFIKAWTKSGFPPVEHILFVKPYTPKTHLVPY